MWGADSVGNSLFVVNTIVKVSTWVYISNAMGNTILCGYVPETIKFY